MKTRYTFFAGVLCSIVYATSALAQTAGDYRSIATGNWSALATWQRYSGTAWVAATAAPTGAGVITIQSTDSVFIDVAVSITGTLKNQGKLGGTGSLTIANGGTYQHDEINGSVPVCTWATGSTCKVTGYVSGSKPSNTNQNFYHFVWSCPGQTANVDLGMSGNTIGGNITIDSTGASSRVYLTSPTSYVYGNPITINGNVIVNGGQFASNGSSTADTIEVRSLGNIVVNAGNFGISRGSGPDVTWKLSGNFTVANATLQNSGGAKSNKLVFVGTTPQNLKLTNVTYGTATGYFTMEVAGGSALNLDTNTIGSSNTGSFIVASGATLTTAKPGGLAAAIQCTGASNGGGNSLSTTASYVFNGTAAQITSTLLPATVDTLVINNAAGVTLSQATTISKRLRLRAGVFNNTIAFTLAAGATISYEGGSLLVPVVAVEEAPLVPRRFFVDQNFPNPFNPSTSIRYGLPNDAFVSARVFNLVGQEVARLFEGDREAGVHVLQFAPTMLGSGIYFLRIQAGHTTDFKRMMLLK